MSAREPFNRWRPHPWHGLEAGPDVPRIVTAFVEITPFDGVKYEIDKRTGFLRVDRPQRSSSSPPCLYGFVPRTYCGERVSKLMPGTVRGDGDPLDVCVLSERAITRSEILLDARVVGGIPMRDRGEADDKIIAVLVNDALWSEVRDVSELPLALVERMRHYFATYKLEPGGTGPVALGDTYGFDHAAAVIAAALEDYRAKFGA